LLRPNEETDMAKMFYLPGGTAVGVACKDGVVLASEKRVSYGFTVLSKSGKKVFKITDRIGMASAGFFSDMQAIARILSAEARILELERRRPIPVRSIAKLLANILYGERYYFAETIIGGMEDGKGKIYVLDPLGSLIEDKYVCIGTGSQIAIGIIETGYRDDLTVEEAKELVIKAIKEAAERDAVSGDGIDVLVISKSGIKEEFVPLR